MKLRLTMAQALVRHLAAQQVELDGERLPLVAGMWAIFGHGNVAGMGEALQSGLLPTHRAHNEQSMAHAAIAYAKASRRRRFMACTTSIGPGATNMLTAAALAHINRLPVLLLPGDVFASRRPDPVLQQLEDFGDPTLSVNDCFRPVARFWDRITRPEQLLRSLPQALSVLTDAADCGPVVLCLPQDVQAEAFDYPDSFFETRVHRLQRPQADAAALDEAARLLAGSRRPLLVAGGGVLYSGAETVLGDFAAKHGIPVAETQSGKGSLAWDHPCNAGALGVTGSSAANELAREADLLLAVGTRLQDFSTASHTLFAAAPKVVAINPARHDAIKLDALPLRGDARVTLEALDAALAARRPDRAWQQRLADAVQAWNAQADAARAALPGRAPGDAQVLAVANDFAAGNTTVICASGGLPGELHKLWRTPGAGGYHLEYGYSCMGYEIAAGIGVAMADPGREVMVLIGDGSYLMANSELATAATLGLPLIVVLLDNGGFGCIERLQAACGGESFNNLLPPACEGKVDFAAHAAALGAHAEHVADLAGLAAALAAARARGGVSVIVINTDPALSTQAGGAWWDVPVAEVSDSERVRAAGQRYRDARDA